MNEALAISAANLDTIEKNLGSVANALTGVITDVSSVNTQVNNVETKVEGINNELKNLVREVRENSILTNARQSIMYNNDQIEKKFGYFDIVRRMTEGLLDSIEHSNLRKRTLIDLREQLIVNNPNYWLSNALSALSSWVLDDKENTDKEVHNALKKDEIKTSIFFSIINIKLKREEAAINWLKYYLNRLDPNNLSSEFVTVLDLVSCGLYGVEGKNIIINKINEWIKLLSTNVNIINTETYKWLGYITAFENKNINIPYIQNYSADAQIYKNNIIITSSYENVLNSLQLISKEDNNNKKVDEILNNLIYEYEDKEKEFQRDNLRNKLILDCNGDTIKAEELFKKQESMYSEKVNLLSLLTNIVMFKNEYKVGNETQKLALSFIKFNILGAYEVKNSYLTEGNINITMDKFNTTVTPEIDRNKINSELDTYIENEFKENDKTLLGLLIIINIISVIALFITYTNSLLFISIIVIMILGNALLIYKMVSQSTITKKSKNIKKNSIKTALDFVLAEYTDCNNYINNNKTKYNQLKTFLESVNTTNYAKTNDGRDLSIGE